MTEITETEIGERISAHNGGASGNLLRSNIADAVVLYTLVDSELIGYAVYLSNSEELRVHDDKGQQLTQIQPITVNDD